MKVSLYVCLTDLISAKETLADRLNRFFIPDEKHRMYKIHSLDQILQSLKKAGLDGLELRSPMFTSDEDIKKIQNILKKHEMSILSVHQSNNNVFNISLCEIQNLCNIANKFQAKVITLHSDALGSRLFERRFIQDIKELQRKYKLRFGIENMPKSPFSLFKTYTYNANKFSSAIDNAGLFITLDTTHLAQAKGDICGFYVKNKERIVNIHISDYKKSWLNRILLLANQTHLPLAKGELPITKFLKVLKKENYQGIIAMEINAGLKQLCQSTEIIKKSLLLQD